MNRKNVTDKQQGDVEAAADHSATRFQWFDGKQEQTGETKAVRAYDLQAQGNPGSMSNDAARQIPGSGAVVGSHNDHPSRFETPGRGGPPSPAPIPLIAIISDTFTTASPEQFAYQQPHTTTDLIHQPEINLPGGAWRGYDWGLPGGFDGTRMALNTDGATAIPLASFGSYVRPDILTISADLSVNTVAEDGSWPASPRGLKLGFSSMYPDDWVFFTGLTLHPDGSLDYSQDGVGQAIVPWSGAAFVPTNYYRLSFAIDTVAMTISNIQLAGSTADYSNLIAAASGNITLARTAYASCRVSDANGGNLGYVDNLRVEMTP